MLMAVPSRCWMERLLCSVLIVVRIRRTQVYVCDLFLPLRVTLLLTLDSRIYQERVWQACMLRLQGKLGCVGQWGMFWTDDGEEMEGGYISAMRSLWDPQRMITFGRFA